MTADDVHAAQNARIEGLLVETDLAIETFRSTAVNTVREMQNRIVRDFPEFYTNEERATAGLSRWWGHPLMPLHTLSWWIWQLSRRRARG